MQISRLFNLLYILLTRDRATAPELARELEVSVRTIYRDVQALNEAGMPIYTEPGRSGGISILPTFKLNRALLSDEERQSLLSSLTAAAQSGAQDQALLRKMTAFFGAPAPDWLQIDFADWSGKQDHDIHIIRQSILEKRVLAFDYYGESGCKMQHDDYCFWENARESSYRSVEKCPGTTSLFPKLGFRMVSIPLKKSA